MSLGYTPPGCMPPSHTNQPIPACPWPLLSSALDPLKSASSCCAHGVCATSASHSSPGANPLALLRRVGGVGRGDLAHAKVCG